MIKIYCDVCGKECADSRFGIMDFCKKCSKKIEDYVNHLKKQEKSKKPQPKGWGRTYGY